MSKIISCLLVLLFASCLDLNRWQKRYQTQAKNRCECLASWQKGMSKELEDFYSYVLDLYHPQYDYGHKITTEDVDSIRKRRNLLTNQQKNWNWQLGVEFLDSNSRLSKCFYKEYEWSHETPGNNNQYTVDVEASKMGCSLVYFLGQIEYNEKILMAVFN